MCAEARPVPVSLRPRQEAPPDPGPIARHRITIVVPPGANFGFPPLGPPSLKAYLEEEGASVRIIDVNIEAFDAICSPENVVRIRDRVRDTAQAKRERFADHPDMVHFIDHVCTLDGTALEDLCHLPAKLRDLDLFRHATGYTTALHQFGVLEQLVELAYHPLQFLPGSLVGGMFARLGSIAEMLAIETPNDPTIERILAESDWASQDIIGVSAFSFDQLIFALRMAPRLRAAAPEALLVLGGNVLSESEVPPALQRTILGRFDAMIVGDGERPLSELREVVAGRRTLAEVANAHWLDGDVVRSSDLVYKFAFERDRWPDFDDFPLDLYPAPKVVLPFRFSNGCDWGRCTFCSESVDRGEITSRLAYREAPSAALGRGIRELHERWGGEVLWNCSSQVTARGCAEIGDAIAAAGTPVRWAAMVRAEAAWSPELIERAVAGGARAFNFGVETFVARLNRLMKKGVNVRKAPEQLREFRRQGVMVTLYALMNYPTETLEEYSEHLQVVEREQDAFDNVFKSIFMLVADTPALEEIRRLGFPLPTDVIDDKERGEIPYKSIPNGRTKGHYSSGYAYRWEGDRLEEKDDLYYRSLLDLVMREPRFFDRHLEIVSRHKWWQPEYRMMEDLAGDVCQVDPLTLPELLERRVVPQPGVRFTRLSPALAVLTKDGTATAFYLGGIDAAFIERVLAGAPSEEALREIVDQSRPAAVDLLSLYHVVHGRLRQMELIDLVVVEDRTVRQLAEAATR